MIFDDNVLFGKNGNFKAQKSLNLKKANFSKLLNDWGNFDQDQKDIPKKSYGTAEELLRSY